MIGIALAAVSLGWGAGAERWPAPVIIVNTVFATAWLIAAACSAPPHGDPSHLRAERAPPVSLRAAGGLQAGCSPPRLVSPTASPL
jgi:hypothetical protein